jgi:lysozyme
MTTAGVIASGAGTEIAQTASKELGEEAAKRAASKATAEVGTVVAKKSGKGIITSVIKRIVPKTIAKMFGKSIPLVGAVIGGMFALGKLIKGDFVGAGLEAASGLAGPITAIPLTIISMARDVYREVFDINPETDPQVGERMGEIKNQVTEAANEELTRLTGKGVNDAKTSPDASAGTEPSPSSPSATEATPTSSPASATPDAPAATPSDGAQPSEDQPKDQPPAKSPGFFSSLAKGALSAGRALIASRSLYNNNVRGTATKTPSITNLDDTKKMIIRHEGIRYRPYKDSLGLWTVGVGHLIGNGRNLPPDMNRDFSHDEVMSMFNEDYDHHEKAAMQIPGYSRMNATGKAALIDLTFNMGPAWHKKFPKTVKALAVGDVEGAASGLENSLWYRQVGNRAPEIVSMIRAGASPNVAASTEAAGATPTQAAPAPAPATVGETTGTGASAPSAPSAAPAGDITSQGRASLSANIVRPSVPMGGGTGGGGNVTNIMQGGTTIAGGGSGGSASTPIPAPIDREPTIRRILDGALT